MIGWLKNPLAQASAGERSLHAPDRKESRTGAVIALHTAGRPVWTPRTYAALSRAGFMKNRSSIDRCA